MCLAPSLVCHSSRMPTSAGRKPATPTATVTRNRRTRRSDGQLTHARVLEAAIECILDNGYYQSSSNAIARHAGVTWGTLQHQFGTREGLLLEVVDQRWNELTANIENAVITGDTLEERLQCVMDVLETHYGQPAHVALMQILLDLLHAPGTSVSARRALARHGKELTRVWQPLFAQALGEAATDEDLTRYAFLTIRGYLSSNLIAAKIGRMEHDAEIRVLLIRGIACAIRERAAALGLSVAGEPPVASGPTRSSSRRAAGRRPKG
jgi:AcrR family transcriptional regulator